MGIYSSNTSSTYGPSTDIYSPCVQELGEGYDINYTEAAIMAVAECEKMHNSMMKSIGINELHYFEENGQEIVYEAVDIQGIFNKIKAFFVKLIDKVKAIFHAFVAKIRSLGSDNKDFVNKYRTEFMDKWNKVKNDFEFKGYNFTIKETNVSEISSIFDISSYTGDFSKANENIKSVSEVIPESSTTENYINIKNELNAKANDINDKNEEIEESLRAMAFNIFKDSTSTNTNYTSSDTLDSQEFIKNLFEVYRDGEDKPTTIEKSKYSPSEILSYVSDSDKTIHAAEKVIKNITKEIDKTIKSLNDIEKTLNNKLKNKSSGETENAYKDALSAYTDLFVTVTNYNKKFKEYIVQGGSAYLTALKDKRTQYKAIIAKVIAGGKKMQRESYNYSDYDYNNGSYIESVIIR